ncbi:MAG: response regulator transcription factor [Melioribacteraceae bacterium]|nr:response regulator transcription factor [Melioribacteraceae bacterium]
MYKSIIVDDEQNARDVIEKIISQCFKSIKIVDKTGNVADSIASIKKHSPDLLFLDIDLPDGTGFDILKAVDCSNIRVIFITAHEEHALQAIKFSAFDYILKPIKSSELVASVNGAITEKIDQQYSQKFEAIFTNLNSSQTGLKKIVLKTLDKIHLVNIKDIVHCVSDNNYTTFNLANNLKIMVSKPIKRFEEMLVEHGFLRVHQSHLINLNYIQHYDKHDGGIIVLTNSAHVPVSNNQRAILMQYFNSL